MTDSITANYNWAYPTVNADADTWGTTLNNAIIAIDAQVKANTSSAQPVNAFLTGITELSGTVNTIPFFSAANTIGALALNAPFSVLGGALAYDTSALLAKAGNLSALADTPAARRNLGAPGLGYVPVVAIANGGGPNVNGTNPGDVWERYN